MAGAPGTPARSMFEFAAPDNPNHVELSDDQLRQKYASSFFSPYSAAHGLPQASIDQVRSYDKWMQYLNGNATGTQAMALPGTLRANSPEQQGYNQRMVSAWNGILQQDPSMRASLPENLGFQNGTLGWYDNENYNRDAQGNVAQKSWLDRHGWVTPALVAGGLATGGMALGATGIGGGAGAGATTGGTSTGTSLTTGLVPKAIQGGVQGALQSGAQSGWNPKAMITGGLTGAAGGAVGGIGGNFANRTTGVLNQQLVRAGTGAATSGIASGGNPKAMLTGAALSGVPTARQVAPTASQGGQQALQTGINVGKGALTGGTRGALTAGVQGGVSAIPGAPAGGGITGGLTNAGTNYAMNLVTGGPSATSPTASSGFQPATFNLTGNQAPVSSTFGSPAPGSTASTGAGMASDGGTGGGGWWDKWGPLIGTGAGAVTSAIVAKRAQDAAAQMTPEEQAALKGMGNLAGTAGNTMTGLIGQARPWIQQPANYYQALLSGDRAKQMQAVAPQMAQLTDVYRGAARNLQQSGIRGATRDVASGELARERASKMAGLVTGVAPQAAGALANLGTTTLQTGASMLPAIGGLYNNIANDYWRNRYYAQQAGTEAGKMAGGFARDVITAIPRGGGGSTGGGGGKIPPVESWPWDKTGGGSSAPPGGYGPDYGQNQWPGPVQPPDVPSYQPDWGNDPYAGWGT